MIRLNFTLSTIQLNAWVTDDYDTADILFVSYCKVISLTGLKFTLPLCLLLVDNEIPNKHNNKLNAWEADNLAPLDMSFLSIIA